MITTRIKSLAGDATRHVHHASRSLRRSPGYSAAVIMSLALGMGLNTAIFSVIDATLRQPLPYQDEARLIAIGRRLRGGPSGNQAERTTWESAADDVVSWQAATSLESVALYSPESRAITGRAGAEYAQGATSTTNLAQVLGIRPARGRWFAPDEANARVVVISQRLADRQFAGTSTIGQVLRIEDEPFIVIGVMAPELGLPLNADFWRPGAGEFGQAIARVKRGVTHAQVAQELAALSPTVRSLRRFNYSVDMLVTPLHERLFGSARPALTLLFASSVLLLLIACANVANLSLARTLERRRELAVRLMLGASRWSVARLIVAEHLLLALVGGSLGLLWSFWCSGFLVARAPRDIVGAFGTSAGTSVNAFAAITAILVGLTISIGPVIASGDHLGHPDGGHTAARSVRSRASRRIRQALVAVQLALAMLLMTGTGLLIRSLAKLTQVDHLGFSPRGVVVASVRLTGARYRDSLARATFVRDFTARATAIPSVVSVSLGPAPLVGGTGEYVADGYSAMFTYRDTTRAGSPETTIWVKHVDMDYLKTYGIRLRAGRSFDRHDIMGAPPVAIVNAAAGKLLFPGREPLGATFVSRLVASPLRVVGLVDNALQRDPTIEANPEILLPIAQQPKLSPIQTIAVRTAGAPEPVVGALREALRAIDPDLAATRLEPMTSVVNAALARQRFLLSLFVIFAALAFAVAVMGLYAVVSYLTTQRTAEIGIRLALGAQRSHVLGLILKEGMVLTLAGLAAGVLAAVALGRFAASFVYEINTHDPTTIAATTLLLGTVAVVASYVPARRAAMLDPAVTLSQN